MKIVVFAGGSGTRFWPISREKYPKQFKPLMDGKSTFQVHIENYLKHYSKSNILVDTTEILSGTVKELFPSIPLQNIIAEPIRRDLGPSVALAMLKLAKMGDADEPAAIVWSDGVIENVDTYFNALKMANDMLVSNNKQLIYLGEIPKFPNENIGWIGLGAKVKTEAGLTIYNRAGFTYRPPLAQAEEWLKDGKHLWNTGFFVTTPSFILSEYKRQQPKMYALMEKILASLDTDKEYEVIQDIYPQMESISFDNAILEGLADEKTKVIGGNFKWTDPGTLYALKQFIKSGSEENATKGLVHNYKTHDSLVYNYDEDKLVTTIGLEGFIVVNTPDALLVCHKDQIPEIKNMLKQFEETDLKKYL